MRWVIAALTAAAALVAILNEVASLARFADDRLNFPDGLGWTLPGIVTIATLAGGLMWTMLTAPELRRAGCRLNVTCATISAGAVGLDHAAGAPAGWVAPAFLVGALVPALATWLTHLLARITDTATSPDTAPLDVIHADPATPPVVAVAEQVAAGPLPLARGPATPPAATVDEIMAAEGVSRRTAYRRLQSRAATA